MSRIDSPDDMTSESTAETNGVSRARRLLSALPGVGKDVVAIVNGLFGDALDVHDSRLAIPMVIRIGDTVLPLRQDMPRRGLRAVVPNASPRICLMVHGLMATESIWEFSKHPASTYGELLAHDHDMTVLSLRYNTGRHISTNGRELSHLLDLLVRAWPVQVREINLIGHSMGGLVVRSASHYGQALRPFRRLFTVGRRWTSRVRRVILIAVPNDGAGLEAFVNSTSAALGALPVPPSRWLGLGLDRRSAGIKDLRFGAIHDEDWVGQDLGSRHRIHPHRPHRLRRAEYLLIAGTVTADQTYPISRRLGDVLVTSSSAAGLVDDLELFPGAEFHLFPKLTHNTLAHHPDVYQVIADWW